ncbi:purine or other phosphorylase family 1 [Thioploca ingrica]|uniref:Purine or other phosphorylase family 1 n=1 Tax=Thioploca ingrica TaxID=40754 RepID=A0A090ACJ5_9GAMM|nr:purine or other phosphorylase family 1 [Thioploca ingrica]
MTATPSPRVFISYSWDSEAHKQRVFELAEKLRDDGIDCELDQYHQSPPEGWALWMLRQVKGADFVLMICTQIYYRRALGEESPGTGKGSNLLGHCNDNQDASIRRTSSFLFTTMGLLFR